MFICYCAGTVHRPCRECAGTDRAGSVHQVFIVQGPCMECYFVVAWTVQGPCIDCPELNDQLAMLKYLFDKFHKNCNFQIDVDQLVNF